MPPETLSCHLIAIRGALRAKIDGLNFALAHRMRTFPRGDRSVMAAGSLFLAGALLARFVRQRRRIDIRGSVALITGGSRGLGLLIATELGSLGSRVILVARDGAELVRARAILRSHQIDASIVVADIGVRDEATRVVAEVIASHGRLDILVNNAGVMQVGPLDHMTREDFEEAMAVHLWGPFEAMRAAIPQMRRQGGAASSTSLRSAARSAFRISCPTAPASSR